MAGAILLLSLALWLAGCMTVPLQEPDIDTLPPEALSAEDYATTESCFRKANAYANGRHYWKHPLEAFYCYRQAAERGHIEAQERTAWGYQFGLGTTRNMELAALWYQRAAEAGDTAAQASLARLLAEGVGVERSPARHGFAVPDGGSGADCGEKLGVFTAT